MVDRSFNDAPLMASSWLYPVVLLTIIYLLNFVDRQIVNILAEPIKNELGLHDWQIGVLTGLSFALAYGAMAMPFARLAERLHRPRLIAAALTLWSGASIACGFTRGFGQLATARVAVAAGESGFTPAAHSLISSITPPARRTLAFGIFSAGPPLGGLIAMAIGGVIADTWGWRMAFLAAGVPGIVVALLLVITVRDPRKGPSAEAPRPRNFLKDAKELLGRRAFRLFVVGGGFNAMSVYGTQAFIASFILRSHGPQLDAIALQMQQTFGIDLGRTAVVGPLLGIMTGITGIAGVLIGGAASDWLVRRDLRNFSLISSAPLILAFPFFLIALATSSIPLLFSMIALQNFLFGLAEPARLACVQSLASASTRATASAVTLLAVVMFGNGLGPFFVGLLSDGIAAWGMSSGDALRLALAVGTVPSLFAGVSFLLARRDLAGDIASAAT